MVSIMVHANADSASDGLHVEWSMDGISVFNEDKFKISSGTTKQFTFGTPAKYTRIKYINGPTTQSSFHLQTILHPRIAKSSSHRIQDNLSDEDDAELVKAVISAKKPDGTFTNVASDDSGRLQVTLPPPTPPPFTTAISISVDTFIAGSSDTIRYITNGDLITIQRINGGAATSASNGAKIELFYDPLCSNSSLEVIAKAFLNGSNFQTDLLFQATGNGSNCIRLRRTNSGGGSLEIFARWEGFEE
ncbi:MAG: hypothetical protein A3F67_05175 [Verrucomicrobia bacterium RIFCSPHIGHO2_12_FULL_41_10]|nr:MAG: hypothetical protein A3F67_05175 [Verrucomicrobia bacterium RIFCSPHIGHO2_12_FULL_41_10]